MIAEIPAEILGAIDAARDKFTQKAIRIQYGETMLALANEYPDFLVLTADLMYATGMEQFGKLYPSRLINLGIAEQNMTGVAAGLALCGKLPIVCGYAAFTTLRAVEQAKVDAAYNSVKIILTAQSAGLSYGVGGPTHQTFEDVAIMRAIPNMIVLVPSDANEVDACLRAAVEADTTSPIYIRLGRGPEYSFNPPSVVFQIGKSTVLRDGGDIAISANGSMVFEALIAADYLAGRGIGVRVVNLHSVKPIDAEAVRSAAKGVEAMLVIEEHSVIGGLGSAVLECLAETPSTRVRRIGIQDLFPPIGPTFQLRASLGLCAENLVVNALELLGQSSPAAHAIRI
jgi:transketolase